MEVSLGVSKGLGAVTIKLTTALSFAFFNLSFILLESYNNPSYARYRCYDDSNKIDVTNEFSNVEKFIKNSTQKISELQLLLTKIGDYGGKIDGKFGQETATSLCGVVQMYIAIGGKGPDWGISRVSDVPRFIGWLYTAVNASETGGEFPD